MNKELFNSITALGTVILTTGLSRSLWQQTVVWVFSIVAAANHFMPNINNKQANAAVKMSFSHVVLAVLGAPWWMGFAANAIDMLNETVGGAWRMCAQLWMVRQCSYTAIAMWLMGKTIYAFERRMRISSGMRDDYTWRHAIEHLNTVVLFGTYLKMDLLRATSGWVPIVIVAQCALIVAMVKTYNSVCVRKLEALPKWASPCREWLHAKTKANASGRPLKIIMKCMGPFTNTRIITWADIEHHIDHVIARHDTWKYDVVVGIRSGGAFIAPYVARSLSVDRCEFIHSRMWSGRSPVEIIHGFLHYNNQRSKVSNPPVVNGMRVLLVDDSLASGATLRSCTAVLKKAGAARVDTFVLFASPHDPRRVDMPTFCYKQGTAPLTWPWGYECD